MEAELKLAEAYAEAAVKNACLLRERLKAEAEAANEKVRRLQK